MALSIRRIEDKEDIYSFLKQDRLYAAYAIGDLEPSLFGQCDWYAALRNGRVTTLCLRFKGLHPNPIFTMGANEDLIPILDKALRPQRAYFASKPDHLSVLKKFYSLQRVEKMFRMVLDPGDFSPVDGPVVRLGPTRVNQLQELYRWGGDVAFASYQIERGVFYGLEKDHKLVATAGTHLVSRTYNLGIIGNVFTHPDHRRRGYAAVCTSAVIEELLSQSLDVVLNVGQDNEPAIKIYYRLGFHVYCPFVEALGARKKTFWGRLLGQS
jgi:GNAT superfamily N-acetyltransferase